jgi:hypothetical protein
MCEAPHLFAIVPDMELDLRGIGGRDIQGQAAFIPELFQAVA